MVGHADAVDGVDPHLVGHTFNHAFGFIRSFRVGVKVQPHPPVAFLLLSLQHVTWETEFKPFMILLNISVSKLR